MHNVNLAPIKASVGTSADNRKSLFSKKHPVVGPGLDDPSCCKTVQSLFLSSIFKALFTEQSSLTLKINNKDFMCRWAYMRWLHRLCVGPVPVCQSTTWYVLFNIVLDSMSDPPVTAPKVRSWQSN